MNKSQKTKGFDYSWVIIALCFMMVFTCLGFCSSNKSMYLAAITDALHIERSLFSVSDSIRYISTAVINVFFGTLFARLGAKKLIAAGFLCLISSALLNAVANNVIVFYIAGALLGLGLSWTTTTMVGAIVNAWRPKTRGTVMGTILAANGLGGALAAQIVSPMINDETNPFGYRNAYFLVALILLVVGALVLIFLREEPPENYVEREGKEQKKKSKSAHWSGIDAHSALKKKWFYVAAVCIFLTGMSLQGVSGVGAAHMKDVGLDAGFIAAMLSVGSLLLTGSKLLNGIMYDKLGLRVTMTVCDICAVLTMVTIALMDNTLFGKSMTVAYTIVHVIALPLETVMLPIFAADLFGEKSFNQMMGIFVSINTACYAIGAPLANAVFDVCATYKPMFIFCGCVMAVVTVVFQFVLNASHKERARIEGNK